MSDLPDRPMGRGRGRARGSAISPPLNGADMDQKPSPSPVPFNIRLTDSVDSRMSVDDPVPPHPAVTPGPQSAATTPHDSTFGSATSARPISPAGKLPLPTIPEGFVKTHNEKGKMIPLVANYFRMNFPVKQVYDYHIAFEPDVEILQARRRIVFEFMSNNHTATYAFDGQSNLKCLTDIGETNTLTGVLHHNQQQVKLTITRTGMVDWSSLEMIRTLNVLMKRNFRIVKFALMGRHYFDVNQRASVQGHGIELIPGFATAVGPHDGGILMVCDNVTKVARLETCLDHIKSLYKANRGGWQDDAKRDLCGSIVLTSYNNRTYRVDDVDFKSNPQSTFPYKDGSEMSYARYYEERHNVMIRDMRQPMLIVMPSKADLRAGRDKPIYLVPELCKMTGLTDSQRANFQLMRAVATTARLGPGDRVKKLADFAGKLTGNEEVAKNLAAWNVTLDPKLLEVKGVLLEGEQIFTGTGDTPQGQGYDQVTADFSRVIRGKCMRKPVDFRRVAVIFPVTLERQVREFMTTLERVLRPMGCNLSLAAGGVRMDPIKDDRVASYVTAANNYCGRGDKNAEILVVILPTNAKERYDAIKKYLCCDAGVPSQVVVAKTISNPKMLMSICTKIGIQMSVKMGAQPWSMHIPAKGMMVIGYDTYHDSSRKNESVGGFVASMNNDLTAWYSKVGFHRDANEMSGKFAGNVMESLLQYNRLNGHFPSRIIIYRDGVSDGQIDHVLRHEAHKVAETLAESLAGGPESRPQLTMVIVTKRINARFFARKGPAQYDNPPPGTAVDREVTRSDRYDFYLVSQSVRQGTVAPTHYNVILESQLAAASPLKIIAHQKLAYKLTHLYYNWNGTIRVPAPCQYAHKLAFLVGTSLHREPDERLADKLYFL